MSRRATFVSEPLVPLDSSFDTDMMSRGEPGVPHKFHWRNSDWEIAEILESRKNHGDCTHGSGERYVRKHIYRVRTADGSELELHFQRTFGRGKFRMNSRWSVYSVIAP